MGNKIKLNKLLALAAFAACFGLAAPVSATVVQVQYTGTVNEGYDTTGVFGTAGSYLNGLAYTAIYTFETTYGYTYSSSDYNYAYGGTAYGILSPALSSTVTINSIAVAIAGNWFGELVGYNIGSSSQIFHQAQDYATTGSGHQNRLSYNFIYNYSNTLPASLTDPFSYAVTGGDYSAGYVHIEDYDYSSGYNAYAYASLTPDHVTIGPPMPIPEPETYALLLAGLGLLGFAARRRKRKETAAA